MKIKLIYLICMILCVFLTFSVVSAADLNESSENDSISDTVDYNMDTDSNLNHIPDYTIDSNSNSAVSKSQSESSKTTINENIESNNEDKDCVDSVNELSNLNSDLNSINSDEKSLKSSLNHINSNINISSSIHSKNNLKSDVLSANSNTFNDLQTLINNAQGSSIINLEGKSFIGNGTPITINKPITINGGSPENMATLDGKNLSSILKIQSSNVHLINCNFINGLQRAVDFLGNNSSVSNCNFKYNFNHLFTKEDSENFTLENSNFSFAYLSLGSSVTIPTNNVIVRNCSFINNTVENYEYVQGHGAALQIGANSNSTNVGYVINCSFINNTDITNAENTHAGALCFRPGIKVINSTFINNYCNKVGGATTLHSDGELINCVFINNSAGEYGGAISTGFLAEDISVNITNCTFINNSAPMGGAIQIKGHNVKVTNSIFEDNKANESEGGAVFIVGNDAIIINSTFNNNFANTYGAGILINGSNAVILNSSFDKNIADYGAAVYVIGPNANLFSSNFTNHNVENGSVYIKGLDTYVYDCIFKENVGQSGVGLYIEGSNTNLIASNFSLNNASHKGGAIYIDGSNAQLVLSKFLSNNAIPDITDLDSGLGGAIYIRGDNNLIDSSIFNYNTARNGSAIYTDGKNMTLSNSDFDKNQAWSYVLASYINPAISYFNESDILINFTLIGGNNIANAIYNTASMDEIYFYNVSYISSKGQKHTGDDEIHPVDGAQNSNDGSLLYQDDREDNQLVNVIIFRDMDSEETLFLENINENIADSSSNKEIILNKTFNTGILGDIAFNLSDYIDEALEPGKYLIYAKHYEDDYYKGIDEENQFDILPLVDLAVNIGSSRVNIDYNKTVKYTIKVNNNGPNDASGVNLKGIIPEGLIYVSSSPSIGTYDEENGIWNIGDLLSGDNQTLIINVITNKTGLIDFPVNVSSIEDDSNMTNNFDNKTIRVLMADLEIDINASDDTLKYGDIVNWTITVRNNGPNDASKIIVLLEPLSSDLIYLGCSNSSFNETTFKWEIPSLLLDDEVSLVVSTKVNSSNKEISLKTNVSAETYDPIESNNFDSDSVNLLPLCDLAVTIIPDNNPVNVGDTVNWVINITNIGPDNAGDVIVFNKLPDGLEYIVHESSKGEVESKVNDLGNIVDLNWNVGDLGKNESAYLVISTKTLEEGTVLNDVIANSSTLDINQSNNYDDANIDVLPLKEPDDNNTDDNSSKDNDDSNSSDGSPDDDFDGNYDGYYDDYPWKDYNFLDDDNHKDGENYNSKDLDKNNNSNDLNKKNSLKNKSNGSSFKEPIDISSKKSGNPLILVILSIFALISVGFRKYE